MILLDTSTVLWTLGEPERLSPVARDSISAGGLWVSIASYWEVVIKVRKGLLEISDPVSWWSRAVELFRADVLPIRGSHVGVVARLPDIHRDPFDRILIAQSIAEGLPLVTNDQIISKYPLRTIW